MNKRNTIITIIALLLIISGLIIYHIYGVNHKGFDVEIKNNTNENINGLVITYKSIVKEINLPEIEATSSYKFNVNPNESFSENSMIIYYKDKRGYIQKNTLIGYFEKGYNGKVKVNINSIDKNGLIMMKIQEN